MKYMNSFDLFENYNLIYVNLTANSSENYEFIPYIIGINMITRKRE
uniref:Uncharacterized protein n=1 Tax=Pithovirus LCDPAC01 TaxID=2506600 RepID=A0A481YNY2_9VIRU|nr:MAG: hypothetical protein LCDPAC01_00030 [Pithovirus LCDPAC01]